jgi:hypothetical protein
MLVRTLYQLHALFNVELDVGAIMYCEFQRVEEVVVAYFEISLTHETATSEAGTSRIRVWSHVHQSHYFRELHIRSEIFRKLARIFSQGLHNYETRRPTCHS